jgi:hypothetical protein
MKTWAWIMLVFGCVVVYGGLVWSLVNTRRSMKKEGKGAQGRAQRKQ